MSRKKVTGFIFGSIFLALSVYAMAAWINNLDVAIQWHSDVFSKAKISAKNLKIAEQKEETRRNELAQKSQVEAEIKNADEIKKARQIEDAKKAEANKKSKEEKVFHGLIPSLDWACVDMTTVSTFVPFLGFLLIGVGFFRIALAKKDGNIVSKNFPFFEEHDRIMVILGLAGTLWGIIMIGYYPTEEVTMQKLMLCLHTSLYSTLVVILWIFLVTRPISNIMQSWYKNVTGKEISGEIDIADLFRKLGASVSDATLNFKEAGKKVIEFQKQTEDAKKDFVEVVNFLQKFKEQTGLDVFGAIQLILTNFTVSNQNLDKTLQVLQAESIANQEAIKRQTQLIDKQEKFMDQLNKKLAVEISLKESAEQRALQAEAEKEKALSWLEQTKAILRKSK